MTTSGVASSPSAAASAAIRRVSEKITSSISRAWVRTDSWPDAPSACLTFSESYPSARRSEEHTSELQSPCNLVCRLLLEKKKKPQLHILRDDVLGMDLAKRRSVLPDSSCSIRKLSRQYSGHHWRGWTAPDSSCALNGEL